MPHFKIYWKIRYSNVFIIDQNLSIIYINASITHFPIILEMYFSYFAQNYAMFKYNLILNLVSNVPFLGYFLLMQ